MAAGTLGELRIREREIRRELILVSAQRLFAKKDFRSVTVREIAREAGVSPGTIYRYYENLDDLFIDILLAGARAITSVIDAECSTNSGCSLRRFCEIYIAYLNKNMTFYQMMGHFMLGGNFPPEKAERLNPVMRALMDRVEGIIQKAGLTGDTRLVSHALFSALNGIMISYARYPGRNLDQIRRHTLRLAGVVAEFFQGKA